MSVNFLTNRKFNTYNTIIQILTDFYISFCNNIYLKSVCKFIIELCQQNERKKPIL